MRFDAHIVGAGLAGSLLAVYLARRGLRVLVLERRPDLRREAVPAGRSINLALANRGFAALAGVGLEEAARALTIPMRGRMLHDERGALQLTPYGQRPHEVIYSISRTGLNALLMDAAEATGAVELRFNQRVDDLDVATGELDVHDERRDTRYALAGAPVIAADGGGSRVRAALMRAPGARLSEALLPHDYKELTIPPAADGTHRMEPNALHIWPRGGFMLIALPNLDGSFTVTLFLPHEGPDSFATLVSPAAVEEFFQRVFADAVPLMPTLVTDFFNNPTGLMGTVRCSPWHADGRVLLIGDAAHAIVPFHGQGMNAAFEDCRALDLRLTEHGGDWARAFAAFDRMRKPDAEAIADMALENYVEMRDAVRDPRYHLQKALAFELERRHPGVFIPRYSMVMFHGIPYAEAQRRGAVQQHILDRLTADATSVEAVDQEEAARLIERELRPLVGG
jgi:kynurenine 3-monooxygenase